MDDFGQSSSNLQRISCISNIPHVSAAWAARGKTPLHLAVLNGHVEVVKLMVEVASLAVQDKEGRGPQLQSSCGSLALALRCWLHLVASPNSNCRSSDKMLSRLFLVSTLLRGRELSSDFGCSTCILSLCLGSFLGGGGDVNVHFDCKVFTCP